MAKIVKKKEKEIIRFDVKNEQIILSQIAKSNAVRRRCCRELSEYHFQGKRHKLMFNIFRQFEVRNLDYNEDTFDTLSAGEDYGGIEYLRDIVELFEENTNIDFHLNKLKVDALKISLRKKEYIELTEALEDQYSDESKVLEILDRAKSKLRTLFTSTQVVTGKIAKKDYIDILKLRQEEGTFQPTYFEELDKFLTEGLARKKCSVLAGRPSMGKTTLVVNLVKKFIKDKKKVLVCSLEVGKISFLDSLISSLTKIDLNKIIKQTKNLTTEEKLKIQKKLNEVLDDENLHIIEDTSMTLTKLGTILENSNYDLCIIDLFDKLADVESDSKILSNKLKEGQNIAKTANIHLMFVNQIKRGVEKKKNKRPTLEDLKWSGAYEEIADLVMFLHREKYYNPNIEKDIIEIIIAKQRFGVRNKTVAYEFYGNIASIENHVEDFYALEEEDDF